MKAPASFRNTLLTLPDPMERMLVMVFGSLAWTSRGHATDKAIILGLAGHSPESISPEDVEDLVAANDSGDGLAISGGRKISFAAERENAAEIAMDQPLRLTCDPVAGLVQIPCMERNAFGAVKAQMLHILPFSETGCTQSHSIK